MGARVARWLACGALAVAPGGRAGAQQPAAAKTAHITYLTSATAYVDAGRLDGLGNAARLDVMRGGASIAVLRVAYLASHRAACDIVSAAVPLAVGDSVRFVPVAVPRDSSVAVRDSGTRAPLRALASRPGAGLRGRVGVQYALVEQRDGTSGQFSQPSVSLFVGGHPFGAPSWDMTVDVRSRETYTILADGSTVRDGRNRVYQAALALAQPGSPARVTVGRQLSGNLAPIGLFDGALAELNEPDWAIGGFTGTEPDPIQLGFSSAIVQGGGYLQRHSRPGAAAPWSLTFGASGSYEASHVNREFVFLAGSYLGPRLSAFLTQEVDYYRAWKLLPGMHAISPTSTFAIVRYRVTDAVTVDGGFDNRRNVRLYTDVVNPETVFDATFRQGAWGGMWLELARRYRVGLEARSSSGGAAGAADAYTVSFAMDRVSRLSGTLRTRTTYYTNPQTSGWLQSAAFAVDAGTRVHLELNGGLRAERDPLADPTNFLVTWLGADVDVTLAHAWYLMCSATRQRGGTDGNDQIYAGVSYRF
ncbi:MAG TPA: hypothetical protein VEU74_13085 [Gemmatimonadales bacterium]|nr:hypothetical protein [Gemmatimonadales bacterium]